METAKLIMTTGCVAMVMFSIGAVADCVPIDGGNYDLEAHRAGGVADSSDRKASKVINSDIITKFSLDYLDDGAYMGRDNEERFPAGNYKLLAERRGDGAFFSLVCDREGALTPLKFERTLPLSALDELASLIKKHNLAAVNGSSKRNSALGTYIDLEVAYDSGETITAYAAGGVSTVPRGWCGADVFTAFFADKLQTRHRLTAPLYSCSYGRSNDQVGLIFSLNLASEPIQGTKRAILQKTIPDPDWEAYMNGKADKKEVFVPKEKLEELEALVAAYPLKDWQDLPDRPKENSDKEDLRSIVFNYSDSKHLALDSDKDLPPEGREALDRFGNFLEKLAAEAFAGDAQP